MWKRKEKTVSCLISTCVSVAKHASANLRYNHDFSQKQYSVQTYLKEKKEIKRKKHLLVELFMFPAV